MRRRTLLLPSLGLLPCTRALAQVSAVPWPARPVRIIVPFPAGSPAVIARLLADRMTRSIGQPVVVESRAGAGGTIGADAIAKSAPDGHTLGICNTAPNAIAPAVYPGLPYDPARDFTYIALLGEFPLALAVAADGPFHDLAGLLAAARAKPGSVRVGTPGNGTAAQLSLEVLRRLGGGAEFLHVPYRGGSQGALEAIAGRIEATVAGLGELGANDRLRLLALAAEQRLPRWPAVPTFREQGIDFLGAAWFGLCGPAGLPEPVIGRLTAECAALVAQPEAAAVIEGLGSTPNRGLSRAAFTAFVVGEAARWGELARATGTRAE